MKPGTNSASTSRQEEMYDRAIEQIVFNTEVMNAHKNLYAAYQHFIFERFLKVHDYKILNILFSRNELLIHVFVKYDITDRFQKERAKNAASKLVDADADFIMDVYLNGKDHFADIRKMYIEIKKILELW